MTGILLGLCLIDSSAWAETGQQGRLEAAIISEPHIICTCGARIDFKGSRGLSCFLGFCRIARPRAIYVIIHRSLSKAWIPSIIEPPGLPYTAHASRKTRQPDNDSMVSGSSSVVGCDGGRHPRTIINIQNKAVVTGATAEIATKRKDQIQRCSNTDFFVPPKPLGPQDQSTSLFWTDLSRRLTARRQQRNVLFAATHLIVCIHRRNLVKNIRGPLHSPAYYLSLSSPSSIMHRRKLVENSSVHYLLVAHGLSLHSPSSLI